RKARRALNVLPLRCARGFFTFVQNEEFGEAWCVLSNHQNRHSERSEDSPAKPASSTRRLEFRAPAQGIFGWMSLQHGGTSLANAFGRVEKGTADDTTSPPSPRRCDLAPGQPELDAAPASRIPAGSGCRLGCDHERRARRAMDAVSP